MHSALKRWLIRHRNWWKLRRLMYWHDNFDKFLCNFESFFKEKYAICTILCKSSWETVQTDTQHVKSNQNRSWFDSPWQVFFGHCHHQEYGYNCHLPGKNWTQSMWTSSLVNVFCILVDVFIYFSLNFVNFSHFFKICNCCLSFTCFVFNFIPISGGQAPVLYRKEKRVVF